MGGRVPSLKTSSWFLPKIWSQTSDQCVLKRSALLFGGILQCSIGEHCGMAQCHQFLCAFRNGMNVQVTETWEKVVRRKQGTNKHRKCKLHHLVRCFSLGVTVTVTFILVMYITNFCLCVAMLPSIVGQTNRWYNSWVRKHNRNPRCLCPSIWASKFRLLH